MQQRTLQPTYSSGHAFFRATIDQLFDLSASKDKDRLPELIATDRMAVSHDGLCVAVVNMVDESLEQIRHNLRNTVTPLFRTRYKGERVETRILHVEQDRLLVWGLPIGTSVRGVYELVTGHIRPRLVRAFAVLYRICRLPHGMFLFGIGTEDPLVKHVWTKHGVLPIDDITSATAVADGGFLFLEQIDGTSYRYRFGARGFVDWFPVLHAQGEYPVALAYVQNQYVLATRAQTESRLRVIGSANTLSFSLPESCGGDIERLWVSPGERSLAWLMRPDRFNASHRALYVNGELVHEGEFFMNQGDLVWAPTGAMLGARLTMQNAGGQERQMIVTQETVQEFPSGTFVREFLVDTNGRVAASIVDDGEKCTPYIYGRRFQEVPIAWNLSWTPELGISFNSVVESVVCRTVDETELLRH